VELNRAVLHSFASDGVRIIDHHTASEQFMKFMQTETKKERKVQGDWSWLVPPMSSSASPIFHQNLDNQVLSPNFYYRIPLPELSVSR
jgi:nitric-oxide synthase